MAKRKQTRLTPGDAFNGATGVNNRLVQHPTGSVMDPSETARAGKRFRIGRTADGRVIHLYGDDVAADQRRQVFARRPSPQPQVVASTPQPNTSTPLESGAAHVDPFAPRVVTKHGKRYHVYGSGKTERWFYVGKQRGNPTGGVMAP